MRTKIYALIDPSAHEVRYIGKTAKPLMQRFAQHLRAANRRRTHRDKWVSSLLARDLRPDIVLIEEVDGNGADAERQHIAQARSIGLRLCNHTDGGEGVLGLVQSPEARARMSAAGKARCEDLEERARLSSVAKAVWADPEKRAALVASHNSPEGRANHAAAAKKRCATQAGRDQIKDAIQTRWDRHRARLAQYADADLHEENT